ncbi:MAG: SIMPL domain-containing protein [Pseudomonadota bacterium]
MKLKYILAFIIGIFFSTPVLADKVISSIVPSKCGLQEQVSVSISFNLAAENFVQAKTKYDEKMQSIYDYAKKQEMKKFELQSMSYNINNNYNNNVQNYQMNGGVNYQVGNSDEAIKFAEFLTQQKFNVSVNGSSYKNGNCLNAMGGQD